MKRQRVVALAGGRSALGVQVGRALTAAGYQVRVGPSPAAPGSALVLVSQLAPPAGAVRRAQLRYRQRRLRRRAVELARLGWAGGATSLVALSSALLYGPAADDGRWPLDPPPEAAEAQAAEAAAEAFSGLVEDVLGPINVGIFSAHALDTPARAPFASVPQWLIEEVVLRQVRALLVPARIIIPRMAERGGGSVVVVTSTQVLHPAESMLALAMGKGTLDVGVKFLALEYSPQGVRVNAIATGPVLTDAIATLLTDEYKQARADITPLGRLAEAQDIAGPIVALASDACGFVTGATLQVNGGIVMA